MSPPLTLQPLHSEGKGTRKSSVKSIKVPQQGQQIVFIRKGSVRYRKSVAFLTTIDVKCTCIHIMGHCMFDIDTNNPQLIVTALQLFELMAPLKRVFS